MARRIKKKDVPEILDDSYFILFAEDLVNCVVSQNSPHYNVEDDQKQLRRQFKSLYDEVIDRAVLFLNKQFKSDDIYSQILEDLNISSDTYTGFVMSLSFEYFDEGFDVGDFLSFCVRISKMAALYYNKKILNAPVIAKSNIVIIMKDHITLDVWTKALRIAAEYAASW